MDMEFKETFQEKWKIHFNRAELPITFYYTDQEGIGEMVPTPSGHQCIIGVLQKVRNGTSLCFNSDTVGCGGGKRYLGFTQEMMPGFEYFLSCGLEGRMEGERYKKTPEIVKALMEKAPSFEAPGRFIIFKRWDKLEKEDLPDVVIFFARPDVLSGLFTLVNFEEIEPYGVVAPFSAGCGSIVQYPYLEKNKDHQRSIAGMFDVSARPFVSKDELSFAVPINKFRRMVENMNESFLITPSWAKVRKRI